MGGYAEVYVRIVAYDELFEGFDKQIRVWSSHADEVYVMPDEFKLLATSEICDIEAMRHIRRPLYGIQWHPEVAHTQFGEETYQNFLKICKR